MHIARFLQVARFSRKRLLALAAAPLLLSCGCATMNHTERGALGGAGIGGVTGAIVGSAVGRPGAGAAIGAGVGGLTGALVGNAIDESEARQNARAVAAQRGPLGLTDVAQLAQQHVSDDVIISQIRTTGSVYQLSANDIIWLKQSGVSDRVVREMQMTAARPPRRVYVPAEPVYIVEPPPPPVHFGIGIGYTHGRRCR